MPSHSVRWGGKITCSHCTITESAVSVINTANSCDEVSKITVGVIKPASGGRRHLKCLPLQHGVKAVVRGNGAVQEIFIYTKNPPETEKAPRCIRKITVGRLPTHANCRKCPH